MDIEELRYATERTKFEGLHASAYTVTKEVEQNDIEFSQFANNLLEDQPWIEKSG
ncbi:hypothetical protein [Neobacillus endophyticus]|uniref:hypothetical protein n=1 Tax=Neobacillus endophyticus TaxID=2738405 RepID=UPI001C251C22|nr:hypothetical protein [Neobacillus endophyticus]